MPAFCANIDFLFRETLKPNRAARAAAAGFRGIEVGHLAQSELTDMSEAVSHWGLEVVLTSLSVGDLGRGGAGYMGVPGRLAEVEQEVKLALRSAKSLGCRRISAPPSRVPQDIDRDTCLVALVHHLGHAADMAAAEGVEILIEPINSIDWPGFLIASTDDALATIGLVARSNVGLQLDLYHSAMQGEQLLDTTRRAGAYLRHVQFADMPGRHEPGSGTLPLKEVFSLLDEMNYRGWVGAEYLPSQLTEHTLSWLESGIRSPAVSPRLCDRAVMGAVAKS